MECLRTWRDIRPTLDIHRIPGILLRTWRMAILPTDIPHRIPPWEASILRHRDTRTKDPCRPALVREVGMTLKTNIIRTTNTWARTEDQ